MKLSKNYKVNYGIPCDIHNLIKETVLPTKWIFLDKICGKINHDSKILDVGCGRGDIILYLNEKGFKNVTGIEYDSRFYTKKNKKSSNLKILRGNAENLKRFKNESFDLIYCNQVLEHLQNPQLAVKEAFRILKHGGLYVIGIPNGYHPNDVLLRIIQKVIYRRTDHLQKYNRKKIEALLKVSGFDISQVNKNNGSLELFLDRRLKKPFIGFLFKFLYLATKPIFHGEIGYEISAIKTQIH